MDNFKELIEVFKKARFALANPNNDYSWSSWEDSQAALKEIDEIIAELNEGIRRADTDLKVLFAPYVIQRGEMWK